MVASVWKNLEIKVTVASKITKYKVFCFSIVDSDICLKAIESLVKTITSNFNCIYRCCIKFKCIAI